MWCRWKGVYVAGDVCDVDAIDVDDVGDVKDVEVLVMYDM